ncbi:alpha/beta fold hydrolase [Phaeobacter gallaeciensis]|nr:alpha/beta fold hydrolase [Phaeobacter gallaeciensis]MDE4061460.1 alpha/beta fold hydrolase [Phaeobacter gallaeciensis]MDE4124345.1 alpha/beta fold hydrolase [Phaeobacter gallaeciensis]MDE4128662.1 alpha/beta fold hydrolase [Phaeobacter gallaeciensis]MEE2633493.1 alpha/beta fold hydrolase [Pseudomonadota bacterium]
MNTENKAAEGQETGVPNRPAPLPEAMPAEVSQQSEHDPAAEIGDLLDKEARSKLAKLTGGLSPAAIMRVVGDWSIHLAVSPGKQMNLWNKAVSGAADYGRYLFETSLGSDAVKPCIPPARRDRRFSHDAWQKQPFNAFQQAFLLQQEWWQEATTRVRGVSCEDERAVSFIARQMLDAVSPANFPLTNPEVLQKTNDENGMNLLRGMENLRDDMQELLLGKPLRPETDFHVGENVAVTPGKVVYRNHLIELIQYDPTTDKVKPEPLLIVPAWIMKYYILDLSPENSMVKYLTEQGYTVFMISWRNPGSEDADLGLDDYRKKGPMAALDAIQDITGAKKIHAAGYCLGGTLLSLTAAAMARDDDDRLASMTLFATQVDFTEAGELMLFINESQVAFLEDMMWQQGYLDAGQMSGAFQLLRSNDLVWSRLQKDYLMGERPKLNDMMAWNADATRMPYRMHSEYLRKLFLNNELATGKYEVGGHPVSLDDLRLPIFAVGTETDHVAPWKSAFKIDALTSSPVTFVLTKGGHNAGVVSEPGHPRRHYHVHTSCDRDRYLPPDEWREVAERKEGSWWPEWVAWLETRSGDPTAPPAMGEALCPAPGTYVLME